MSNMNPDPQTPTLETTASLLYTQRMALNRAGAPTVDPDGAPVSDGWRAKWCAEQVVGLRQHAAQMERDLAVALGTDLRDGWVGLLSLVRKQGADSAHAAPAKAPQADVVADFQRQLDQITEAHAHVQAILDRMGVPAGGLAWRLNWAAEKHGAQVNLLEDVRKALNVGPPSDSDVKPGTDPKRIVDIVRTRTEMLLDERSRRVALAEEVQALERQIVQERQQAINRLLSWMSGERCEIASELLDQVARAVEAGIVTADDANDARRSRRVLATLVLNVDFGKPRTDDIPL